VKEPKKHDRIAKIERFVVFTPGAELGTEVKA
jgi:predicted RNA-binding protein with TRAM domain